MEYDASPGAAAVLLLRIVSKDAYVTPNLGQGLRTTAKPHVPGILLVTLLERKSRLFADDVFTTRGCAVREIFRH